MGMFDFIKDNPIASSIGFGAGGAALGKAIRGGASNPMDAAMPYYEKAYRDIPEYYKPFIDAGKRQLPDIEGGYSAMMDPNAFIKKIGEGYQASPGFEWAKKQGMLTSQNAAAAGGMLGSPQHERESSEMVTGLANQDFYNYLKQALSTYGSGLAGKQGLYDTGVGSSAALGENLAGLTAQEGNLAYAGQKEENQANSDVWSNLFKGAGAMLPFFLG